MDIIIPANFYYFMATRFLRADIQNCQKHFFFAEVVLQKWHNYGCI
jgi:hypothetical protein